ncbi:MAG: T9SS type A sorting domain-containing protein [Bacteroidota bacterium]
MNNQFTRILGDQSLTSTQLSDVQQYSTINNLIVAANNDDRNVATLLTNEINTLHTIALGDKRYSSAKARNILNHFYEYDLKAISAGNIDELRDLAFKESIVSSTTDKKEIKFEINPNPTNGRVNLSYTGDYVQDVQYAIIDNVGKVVRFGLLGLQNDMMLDLTGLPSNTYRLRLYHGSKVLENKRIILIQ